MSGTPVGPDWNGALRLFWSFLWRVVALSTIAGLALGLAGVLLLRLGAITSQGFAQFGAAASPFLFIAVQIEAFRRLAAAYDIRTLGGPAGEQDHRGRR
ncbi:MAG: hypothetical protein ACHQ49_09980 [Elusimicrobiota bacterium]